MPDSRADIELLAEIGRVMHGADDGGAHVLRLRRPVPPALLPGLTEWLRTLPSGIGEAELSARAQAWYGAWGASDGEPPGG